MLENYKEVVEALEETNESYISHRVNDILRVLTSISVIVLPLTLIASIWGMNVGVPGEGDTTDFYVDRRRDGRAAGRDARLLPPPRLAVSRRGRLLRSDDLAAVGSSGRVDEGDVGERAAARTRVGDAVVRGADGRRRGWR